MTKLEAEQYLFQTSWYELVHIETWEQVPDEVREKREEAYRVLEESE